MRLVLDTNVVASALLWGGEPGRLLRLARERRIAAFTSTALLAELADILGRRKFEYKIAASLMSVDQLVDRYADLASVVRDPDDDVVIGTALAARADLVVTGDRSLLAVGAHRDVRILGVSEALAAIGQSA